MKPNQIHDIANAICDRLFRDGQGNTADRLAMMHKDNQGNESQGAGWCRQAVRDQIVAELSQYLSKP